MAAITEPLTSSRARRSLPMLQSGDCLTRVEFHRRYLQTPPKQKFELVEGRVVMASPVSEQHAVYDSLLQTALTVYRSQTPGTRNMANGTVILDHENEVQPDAALWILPASGGQTRLKGGKYVAGAPEWIGEIAYSSAAIDLGDKKTAYARNGVAEYLVFCIPDQSCRLFELGGNQEIGPNPRGILRSKTMPGLWLDTRGFANDDAARVLDTIAAGLKSSEHAEFLQRLASWKKRSKS